MENQLETILSNNKIDPVYNLENYVIESKYRLQKANQEAQKIIEKIKIRNKALYDRNLNKLDVKIGDKVLIKNEPYNKHTSIYSGPFEILEVKDQNLVLRDQIQNKNVEIHKNRVIKA